MNELIFKAEIWNIELVTKEHGNGPLDAEDVDFGLIKITSHTQVKNRVKN